MICRNTLCRNMNQTFAGMKAMFVEWVARICDSLARQSAVWSGMLSVESIRFCHIISGDTVLSVVVDYAGKW